MISYTGTSVGELYKELIERFVAIEFPQVSIGKIEDIVEALAESFIGTKQTRLGPRPNVESVALIHGVIRKAVEAKRPIPILFASASVKLPLGRQIDLAELGMLKQLSCLNAKVLQHYEPGVSIRVRMEDLTELVLSPEYANIDQVTREYRESLQALIDILGLDFIKLVPESVMGNRDEFLAQVDRLSPIFEDHLNKTNGMSPAPKSEELAKEGWYGPLSFEQREYFKGRYRKLYPGTPEFEHIHMMARYFAATLARVKLGIVGHDSEVGKGLEISFVPPQPDTPKVSARVYYRTVPTSHTSNHLAYWDAKGYLRVSDRDNSTRIGLTQWWDTDRPWIEGSVVISNNHKKVSVKADILVEE